MTRWRSLLPAAATLLLASCGSLRDSTYGQYYQLMKQSFANSIGTSRVTRAQAAAIPYASLGYQLGDSPEFILVLATDNGGEQLWTAANHVVLVTNKGRVTRFRGLAHDGAAIPAQSSAEIPAPFQALGGAFSYKRLVDFPDMGLYGSVLTCRMSGPRPETIQVLGAPIATLRISETCEAPSLNWSFTDSFWIDPQRTLVWRSVQHIHPKLDELHIEILRPPS